MHKDPTIRVIHNGEILNKASMSALYTSTFLKALPGH